MALYPYTLQPIPCKLNRQEFEQAQLELFEQTNHIKPKIWIILAVLTAIAIAGIVLIDGYSTAIFWILLIGVGVFLLIRTYGLRWYMKRQLSQQELPAALDHLKLGVQKHGIVMSMPNPNAGQTVRSKSKRKQGQGGMQTGVMQQKVQQGIIPWSAVTKWHETPNFFLVQFQANGQEGSQIIPKRLSNDNFPIETLRQHLSEVTPVTIGE